tara:strand:+ start:22159 stop:22503 length:345 start_codon:yes stop_codon:yes gene_type:complete
MTWNATTAYAGDYQHIDGVESATLTPKDSAQHGTTGYTVKVLWDDDNPEDLPTGQPGLTQSVSALWLWIAGSSAPTPRVGDLLTVDSVAFTVISVRSNRRSVHRLEVQTRLVNT